MSLPDGFVYLDTVDPSIQSCLRYATHENVAGRLIAGYHSGARVIVTAVAAQRLGAVQDAVKADGWCLVVYDAYRPQKAIDDFFAWSGDPAETSMAQRYYPAYAARKPL